MNGLGPSLILAALVITVTPPKDAPGGRVDDEAAAFYGEYVVSFYGLPVASSTFRSSFKDDRFAMKGTLSSAGLARIFDSTTASVAVNGRFSGQNPRPEGYSVSYSTGGKDKRTSLSFSGGRVAGVVNEPPLKKRGKDWVPLARKHLTSVTDPVSAVLVRAKGLDDVCGRTVSVFDGELRADLKLGAGRRGDMDTDAYRGETVTCDARFVPVAGYRPGNKSIAWLRDHGEISVTFAPLGKTGIYAPIHATVGTQIGTITLTARRLEARE
ncbi:MAG: DUF3108 domain-containing protein [Rhizobiaceae bacterium]|nr:MAG: DUF3108 domain-containing protein [Rhizobiaceae bacterium]CAG0958558.1 hypothetical protein RHIZO_00578 [Rhizobiaceae bacterium]